MNVSDPVDPREGDARDPAVRVAIVGGGAAAVYLVARLLERAAPGATITVFDIADRIGPGMPYGRAWTGAEHLANITCDEIPPLVTSPIAWLTDRSDAWLATRGIARAQISRDLLMPRLVLGLWLEDQFTALQAQAATRGVRVLARPGHAVLDVIDVPAADAVRLRVRARDGAVATLEVDRVALATGHVWRSDPADALECYMSPWPAAKLRGLRDHPVGLLGTSLSAIDATMTLALAHGRFARDVDGRLRYAPDPRAPRFKVVMHSRHGLLPSVRTYCDDEQFDPHRFVSPAEIAAHLAAHHGRLSLDWMFTRVYKEPLATLDPAFHAVIRDMSLEQVVAHLIAQRRALDPFSLLAREREEARASFATKRPLYRDDVLEAMPYAASFYTRSMSAEDVIRFHDVLMPLASIMIAAMPAERAESLLALHEAGRLEVAPIRDGTSFTVTPGEPGATLSLGDAAPGGAREVHYATFVLCTGQPRMPASSLPFPTLIAQGVITPARLRFCDDGPRPSPRTLRVEATAEGDVLDPIAAAVDDRFRPLDRSGQPSPRVTLLSFPYIAGLFPDHSGLPFCDASARITAEHIMRPPTRRS
ncbi:MAG: FAD/NAD(P)-binding protein, partial [Myxococcales bacterium]|nr:FAD/NAD(P)-binding protein [Myxococcales bacterium]